MYLVNSKIFNKKQMAFVICNYEIFICSFGHGKIMREENLDKHECAGGWLFLSARKICWHSGSVSNAKKSDREEIKSAIENHFAVYLREVK